MDVVSGKILGVAEKASYFFGGINLNSWPIILLDIIIVTTIFYWAYLFVRETKAIRIVYGLFFLLALMLLGRLMNLVLLNWILKYIMTMLVVAIPVVFQPELRNALEKLGRSKILADFSEKTSSDVVEEIVKSIGFLTKQRIGGLIIIQRKTGLRDYIEKGVAIDAVVSSELLLSIFFPKSPLHDGAVIVVGGKIVAASVSLPVSEADFNTKTGMRHRAGVGITENSDAIAIIISEETGTVSLAVGGQIERRLGDERLKDRLIALLRKK